MNLSIILTENKPSVKYGKIIKEDTFYKQAHITWKRMRGKMKYKEEWEIKYGIIIHKKQVNKTESE